MAVTGWGTAAKGDIAEGDNVTVEHVATATAPASFTVSPPFINIFVSLNDQGSGVVPVTVTLTGQGGTAIDFELAWIPRAWFTVNKIGGTIPANGSASFIVGFNPGAVPPGRYTADIVVDNTTTGAGSTILPITMVVSNVSSGAVTLTPDADIVLRGPEGRLPSLPPQDAVLHNGSDRFVLWEAVIDEPWVTVSPTGGELAPSGEATGLDQQSLDIRPNVAVNNLKAGAYIATASFQNLSTDAPIATRVVHVVVDPLLKITASAPDATIQVYPPELKRLDNGNGPLVYELGDVVTLTAVAPDGFQFVAWYFDDKDGSAESTTDNPAVITMNRSRTATALIQPLQRTLTLSASGEGTGTIKTSPTGQIVDNPLVSHYANGTLVEILAEPDAGAQFLGWAGNVPAGEEFTNPLTLTMDRDRVITAIFETGVFLDVAVSGSGEVSIDPDFAFYIAGDQVTLTPIAAEGFTFTGWSGDAAGNANPLVITLDSDTAITANFIEGDVVETTGFALSINVVGDGEVSPGSGDFEPGARVLLVATPATGAHFVSWEGDVSGTALTMEVVMDADRTIRANFAADDDAGRPTTGTGCGAAGMITLPLTLLGLASLRGPRPGWYSRNGRQCAPNASSAEARGASRVSTTNNRKSVQQQ